MGLLCVAVGEESEGDVCQDDGAQFKFTDGQPVTLEDGSTAYVLSRFKGDYSSTTASLSDVL